MKNKEVDFLTFADRNTLEESLTENIGRLLKRDIDKNKQASLAVSGGSTPLGLFNRLSELDISWKNVCITLVDERWVEPTSKDSNENLVRTHLLKNKAGNSIFIPLKNKAVTPHEGEDTCEKMIRQVPRPISVLLLGLGLDGHTASLFPGAKELPLATDMQSKRLCMGITPSIAPYPRMTLSLSSILHSNQIYLHITGDEKKRVVQQALIDGPAEQLPIRYILHQKKTPVLILWAP